MSDQKNYSNDYFEKLKETFSSYPIVNMFSAVFADGFFFEFFEEGKEILIL